MRLMKNCLIQKLYGFKRGKMLRIIFFFLYVLRGFEISKFIFIFLNWTVYFFHRKSKEY